MAKADHILKTIEMLKRERDLAWMMEELPDWKLFQTVSLIITHYERVAAQSHTKNESSNED